MTRPDLDAIRARCDSTLRAECIDVHSTAHGYRRRACHFARTDIPALLAYIDDLEERCRAYEQMSYEIARSLDTWKQEEVPDED